MTGRTADGDDTRGEVVEVQPGIRIGRYVVLGTLGRGGMGVVLLAQDAELRRRVAIKLVQHKARSRVDATTAKNRLLREAQAMAQLSHPNVITVHDVGTFGERVFVAMEHIEGTTLAIWLEEGERSVEEILRVFAFAARGLAAAHRAGLVHRDFKPDNVMIDDDERGGLGQRVVVLDFGLARSEHVRDASSDSRPASGDTVSSDRSLGSLTMPGWVMGTPSYMAPEQHNGRAVAASDQFAFCVALYLALYGVRPFEGRDFDELARAKLRGQIREFPERPGVPRQVRDAIRRGLSPQPGDRFATMDALLDALQGDARRSSRRTRIVGGLAVAAIVAGTASSFAADAHDPCASADAMVAGIWDDAKRDAVTAGLASAPEAYVGATTTTVVATLDAYAAELADAQRRACVTAQDPQAAESVVVDRRIECLRRSRGDLAALVDVLVAADAAVGERAVDAVAMLPTIATCETIGDAIATTVDPQERGAIEQAEQEASRVRAAIAAGRYKQAAAHLDGLLDRARALDHAPLTAEVHHLHAELLQKTGEAEPAAEAYLLAIDAAAAAGDDRLAAIAWDGLLYTTGHSLAQYEKASGYARHLEAAVQRLGSPPDLEAQLVVTLGILEHDQGRFAQARGLLEHGVELHEELGQEAELAPVLVNLGRTMAAQGEVAAARATVERAIARIEARYGAAHPQVAKTLTYLGSIEYEGGDAGAAKARYERALAIQLESLDEMHPEVAFSYNNIANMLGVEGEHEEALRYYEKARAILEQKLGPDHPNVARLTFNMAELQKLMKNMDAAEAEYRRTVAAFEKAFGHMHPDVARALNNLGSVQYDVGKYEDSLRNYTESLVVCEATLGPEHPGLGYPLTGIGLVHIAAGRPAEAIAPLERSLRLRAADDVDPVDRGDTQYALARALWNANTDGPRALALARDAIDAYRHADPNVTTNLTDATAWLEGRSSQLH